MHYMAVLSNLRRRFFYILGHYAHARSQGGRQPGAANPGLYTVVENNDDLSDALAMHAPRGTCSEDLVRRDICRAS